MTINDWVAVIIGIGVGVPLLVLLVMTFIEVSDDSNCFDEHDQY